MKVNKKQRLLIVLSVFVVMGGICLLYCINRPRNINVILISIDALRPDHLGCYGYRKETSPFLDTFSKDAFIFSNVIAQSASTVPSLCSMFHSRYPYTDCLSESSDDSADGDISISEFLKTKGYYTFGIVAHDNAGSKMGFARGFDYFDDNFNKLRTADEVQKLAIGLLKKIDKSKKFFLWLHFREPHSPYSTPDRYNKIFSKPSSPREEEKIYTINGRQLTLTNNQVYELTMAYDDNIRFVDDNLRILFAYLKRENLIRKSIIIITADHGESLGAHNIFEHTELYYGILRVPLIIKIPYSKGGIISYPASLIDVFPTLLDLLGYKSVVLNLRGRSVFLKRDTEEVQFSEYPDRYSIVKNNWRLFLNKEGNYELYNLKNDPQESNNLVSVEKEKFGLLKQELNEYTKQAKCNKITQPILDEETKNRLRSLGYLQ
jgi:arylsulfatase A-like enzyme